MRSQRRSQFEHEASSKGRSSATNDGLLHARQATSSLQHIVVETWTGPNRCPNGRGSAVRVQA